ncbi:MULTISPECIES: energy-coupling factor transporter transmembrane component T [unclassified Paenibacillus]|uniref:energy-coupling factor transporter transmembrane component T n=1 Tax=unclassified Paenibacillus TaxID=185978 RepID=UPI002476E757|nr:MULTISPECIES: energy-coupling factor transporter transmembrane component T [unclassified Paenibacillus]MDH6431402.1 energy-coupling factor transport system permease protein [Paenibacillus sp. PastH-4]MDH6447504.1 energy-coupling factor transport system permease protein [Paenibacillus sp. PastF-4]MDH6531615.1 energy-coupling factor transport system permease protein [Paenibacillus sp. PastH-3]
MKDSFSTFHPFVNFLYFVVVLLFSMVFMHPIFQVIALISAVAYSIMLKGKKGIRFNLLYMIPFLLFMAVMNPVFNHQGVTILFYLNNGNPITKESILYGVAAACMFVTVIIWFSCYNVVMTSDKFIYIFGKILPALSLIFSMVLRFVPRYLAQIKVISNAQKCIGRDVSQGNLLARARNGITILSIMATWALENAIETADSMRSRGYGLPGRTSFSIFRLDARDKVALLIMTGLIALVAVGAVMGENTMRFYPSIKASAITPFSILIYIAYFALCMIPVLINMVEAMKWKSIESKN